MTSNHKSLLNFVEYSTVLYFSSSKYLIMSVECMLHILETGVIEAVELASSYTHRPNLHLLRFLLLLFPHSFIFPAIRSSSSLSLSLPLPTVFPQLSPGRLHRLLGQVSGSVICFLPQLK